MPEGTVAVGEQKREGAAKPLHERFGFETEDAMAEAFEVLKADLKRYKTEARGTKELQERLAALEAERTKAAEAEMSEVQKLQKRLSDYEKAIAERDARVAAAQREVLTERVFGSRLAGRSPEEAAILRRLYGSAVAGQNFADEAELAELLVPVDADFDALRKRIGGGTGGGETGGGAPGIGGAIGRPASAAAQVSAAAKDFLGLSLAEKVERARKGLLGK